MLKHAVSVFLAAGLLSGCAFRQEMRQVAVNHNKMVADTADELTLLNIVRAKHRMPMHFSRITSMSGNVNVEVSGGLGAEVFAADDTLSPEIGATISSNPSFDAVVMDDEKFQRGIQQQVDEDVLVYLLDNGYSDDLIAALFIEKIDIFAGETGFPNIYRTAVTRNPRAPFAIGDNFGKGDLVGTIINDPNKDYGFGSFLCRYGLALGKRTIPGKELLRWPVSLGIPADLFDRTQLKNYPYKIVKETTKGVREYVIRTESDQNRGLKLTLVPAGRCPPKKPDEVPVPTYFLATQNGSRILRGDDMSSFTIAVADKPDKAPPKRPEKSAEALPKGDVFTFTLDPELKEQIYRAKGIRKEKYDLVFDVKLRSIQDVLYFLGEYIRKDSAGKSRSYQIGTVRPDFDEVVTPYEPKQYTVFDVQTDVARVKSLVSVKYRGTTYSVSDTAESPNVTGDRSATVLTLVQSILNLYKSNDDLPRSSSVRLIGR